MKKATMDKIIKSAITTLLAFSAASLIADTATTTADNQSMEKCYGIVKAGMNDCATSKASCAGSAKKNKQPDAYIFLPKGSCNKIVGGSLSANTSNTEKK